MRTAKILDFRRLGKQRVEAQQILNALNPRRKSGWKNHPAVKMWRSYSEALKLYRNIMILEWVNRGYKNTMKILPVNESKIIYPDWLGSESFHSSHRSNLLRKDPKYYSQFGWTEPDNLGYVWPV